MPTAPQLVAATTPSRALPLGHRECATVQEQYSEHDEIGESAGI